MVNTKINNQWQEKYKALSDFMSLKIQNGQSFSDYCNCIEYRAERAMGEGHSKDSIEPFKMIKLRNHISEKYWYLPDTHVNRSSETDQYEILKNYIISYIQDMEESKELYFAGIVDRCRTDIFIQPMFLEVSESIPQESHIQEATISNVIEQPAFTDDIRSDAIFDYDSFMIQEGQPLTHYCECIEILADKVLKNELPEELLSLAKLEKLVVLLTDDAWYQAEYEMQILRVSDSDKFHWLKNWIFNEFQFIVNCTDGSSVALFYRVPYLPPDIFTEPQFLEAPDRIEYSDLENELIARELRSQKKMDVDKKEDTVVANNHTVVFNSLNVDPVSSNVQKNIETVEMDKVEEECINCDTYNKEVLNDLVTDSNIIISRFPEDEDVKDKRTFEDKDESISEMDTVDQKAKDVNLGPPQNSNKHCSKDFHSFESSTIRIDDFSEIDNVNVTSDPLISSFEKQETPGIIQLEYFTCGKMLENEDTDAIPQLKSIDSLNNHKQKAGLQKPGDVACGVIFEKKIKRRVNEEKRPRTDPPFDLVPQTSCELESVLESDIWNYWNYDCDTVSDFLNWKDMNWKDMSWHRFVRESRPRKDPPWSSCRSEVGLCYGWRWDVSQEPLCTPAWTSCHVMFPPRQAAEVQ
ncbi:SH3 domain-containing protein [Caenorhabditis elegans]|uniref:SH3 domain-containing protein n=1 Tax=Caenorhabditis elegans TaxID=6239 RepID=Q9U273_CAEEL|nr:SH3 domain-containing protein [Caenorhabditis elegans]CAB63374.1 SH3 domain-containing protein [Caenorhabditis elegans]|eukprot:NP_507581.1 Uncharacterized protein CELE_Y51A2A.5 [Caenorhabditis elegans]